VVATAGGIMILLGLLPKAGAIVASIPSSVLGGAALVMFGTVAAVGIQTLGRVDFNNHRNVIVVAVSIAIAMIPVGLPQVNNTSAILVDIPKNVQAFLNSGITMGSITAIILNLALNYYGGPGEAVAAAGRLKISALNAMSPEQFVSTVGPAYQGQSGIAERVAGQRPFEDAAGLRRALQDQLFALSRDEQVALMRSYPSLAGAALHAGDLGKSSLMDQAAAGLTFLSEEEQEAFDEVNIAYQQKFDFPLIIAARELSSEQMLEQAWNRLDNSPTQEHAAALLEIAKIANHRLADTVEETNPLGLIRSSNMQRLH
jgi:OHCU decarboxylase